MSGLSNFHTHTIFCDGKNTAEEMVQEAIKLSCPAIGFSSHSNTPFDPGYCMDQNRENDYIEEIERVKAKYKDEISIYLGIEEDYFSCPAKKYYQYIIGSVHYVKKGGEYISIDDTPEILENAVNKYYGGDFYLLCEDYYKLVKDVVHKTKCDIVGHFDLITKFNEKHKFFDENNPRYKKAALSALNVLLDENAILEINTGAISRGWKTQPYPANFILEEIGKRHGKVILSSDAHSKEHLLFGFERAKELCEKYNIDRVKF